MKTFVLGISGGQDSTLAGRLAQLAMDNNIGLEHIISFGNAENDISMLSETGYSVAVSNATEHVKSVANEVCGHHNEDGVAHWIEKNLL